MSAELEALQRGYDTWWKEGDPAAFAALPDDFVSESRFGLGFSSTGREEFARMFREWRDFWQELDSSYEFEDLGEGRVLVDVTTQGRGAASGIATEMRFAQVWTFEAGTPRRVTWFASRDQALADSDA